MPTRGWLPLVSELVRRHHPGVTHDAHVEVTCPECRTPVRMSVANVTRTASEVRYSCPKGCGELAKITRTADGSDWELTVTGTLTVHPPSE